MNLSEDTKQILQFIEYLGIQLRKKNDFAIILELSATYGYIDDITKLIFASASVWNLSQISKKLRNNDNAYLLEKELNKSIVEMLNPIREIIIFSDKQTKERFDRIYFAETDGAIKNIIDLAHDFSTFKDLQNQNKRISKNKTDN